MLEHDMYNKASFTAKYLKDKINIEPEIAIILGSGLGPLVDKINYKVEIDYKDIPNFPLSTVEGHAGKLIYGNLSGKNIIAMQGRFHYYEGYELPEVTFAIRVFNLLGIDNLIVTNAAGGINKDFKPGDLMLITDHISFLAPSTLRGKNQSEFGVRFPDMSEAYSKQLTKLAKDIAQISNINVREGVYAFMQGPTYETPAEVRALSLLGVDAVGMSTVPEVVVARHCGMRVLGISCITNMATGILDKPLNHQEVITTAKEVENKFILLVSSIVEKWEL